MEEVTEVLKLAVAAAEPHHHMHDKSCPARYKREQRCDEPCWIARARRIAGMAAPAPTGVSS